MKQNFNNLIVAFKDNIFFIGLNRPQKRNALDDQTISEIDMAFSNLPKEAKCVILFGEGKHFCAGADLSDLKQRTTMEGMQHSRSWHSTMDRVQFSNIPVIAVLHGACVGGGLELAASCHIRVADESTFYALPEGQRGIFTGGGGALRVPKLIGVSRMADMMLTGRVYKADEGNQVGLSQYVVKEGKAKEKAIELAKKICENTSMTNYILTNVLPRIVDGGHDVALMMEALAGGLVKDTPEAKKRLTDFLEGRAKKVGQ